MYVRNSYQLYFCLLKLTKSNAVAGSVFIHKDSGFVIGNGSRIVIKRMRRPKIFKIRKADLHIYFMIH